MNIVGVRYVTVRRPVPQPGDEPDHEIRLYREFPPGFTLARHIVAPDEHAVLGLLIVDDEWNDQAQGWLEEQEVRHGWSFAWHDSYTVAEATLHNMEAAEQ